MSGNGSTKYVDTASRLDLHETPGPAVDARFTLLLPKSSDAARDSIGGRPGPDPQELGFLIAAAGVRVPVDKVRVTVDPDVLHIGEGPFLTSVGAGAGLNLCLHIGRDHGVAVAADVAPWIVVASHRVGGQAQFIPPSAQAAVSASPAGTTEPARTWALAHLDQPISIDDLARRATMSRRTFARRFRSETGVTPGQWLLDQRLRTAQSLLEITDRPVEQIAHESGFGNAAALRAHFARRLRTTPTAYRRAFTGRARQVFTPS